MPMRFFPLMLLFFLTSCMPQNKAQKMPIQFEDIYHHNLTLSPQSFLIIDTQEKMNTVYALIHKNYGGGRMAPIPTVSEDETYLIFKPKLKNTNDVDIQEIDLEDDILYITVKPVENPQIDKSIRTSPNVLVKLLQKVSFKKIVIN